MLAFSKITRKRASLSGVYIVQDDRFQYVNPALAKIFGYTPETIVGQKGSLDLVARIPIGQFMYFVPLISPQPVSMSENAGNRTRSTLFA